jgi:hypothetical protein
MMTVDDFRLALARGLRRAREACPAPSHRDVWFLSFETDLMQSNGKGKGRIGVYDYVYDQQ